MVHFIFQMNLQLIFWIGLISSVCYVFGQTGKKSFIVVFSLQYLVSLFDHFRCLEKPTSGRLAPSESLAVASPPSELRAGPFQCLQGPFSGSPPVTQSDNGDRMHCTELFGEYHRVCK